MTSITLVAGMIWGIAAPALKEVPKKDAIPSIIGTWKMEKMICSGMDFAARDFALEFTTDGKVIQHVGRESDKGQTTYKVNPTKTPGEFDWLIEGKKEQTQKGIFVIDGDTLTICIEFEFDAARPGNFESPAGTKLMLWKLTRISMKD